MNKYLLNKKKWKEFITEDDSCMGKEGFYGSWHVNCFVNMDNNSATEFMLSFGDEGTNISFYKNIDAQNLERQNWRNYDTSNFVKFYSIRCINDEDPRAALIPSIFEYRYHIHRYCFYDNNGVKFYIDDFNNGEAIILRSPTGVITSFDFLIEMIEKEVTFDHRYCDLFFAH